MKKQTQGSLLKWASLLSNRPISSLIDIQNTDTLILLLNKIQRLAFQQLYNIDQRASNSALNILKAINSYYKKQLNCNVTQLIDGLNIFKNPLLLWELMIGIAIKGKNRDANINIILQMEAEEQSQLMLLVQEVIEKLNQYDLADSNLNNSQISNSSDSNSIRNRKPSQFSHPHNKRDQFLNQLIQENQLLKDKNIQLHNQLTQLKSLQEQIKKTYEDRLNHFKTQRYQFLEVLQSQSGSSTIESAIRSRTKTNFGFRESIISSESRIMDDPLHELNISITGSLSDIATDMLNAVKNLKKETQLYVDKSSLLEDHNKDLKVSLNQVLAENKLMKEQCQKALNLQKELQILRSQNEELMKNETQLIKMMKEVQEQKKYMRDMVDKLKQEKNTLMKTTKGNYNRSFIMGDDGLGSQITKRGANHTLGVGSRGQRQDYDLVRGAPSFILRQMSSQYEAESTNLNEEIDGIKNPALKDKYQKEIEELKIKNEKQVDELKEKNTQLRQQNHELRQMNKILQKTIHSSMEKTDQIQKNIEEGYLALFGIRNSVIQPAQSNIQAKNELQESNISIKIPETSSISVKEEQKAQQNDDQKSKIVQFYDQIKKTVQAYEKKQLLMMIEIESLKKQLQDVLLQKERGAHQSKEDCRKNRLAISNNQELNFKKSHIHQQIQPVVNSPSKQNSFVMFNINVSGPGGENLSQSQKQQYQVRRSKMAKSQQNNQEKQKVSKRNNEVYPSQEFIQIQQGQELNQNQFASIITNARKSKENSARGSIDDRVVENDEPSSPKVQMGGFLNVNSTNSKNNLNKTSTIQGIYPKDQKRSFFAKSGFYNESFIELSNRLQSQIVQDLQEMKSTIRQKSASKLNQNMANKNKSFIYQGDQTSQNQEQKRIQEQNQILVEKLEKIKKSYDKIKKFHTNSAEEIASQLKEQHNEESQIAKLKITNESLQQSLTLMISQKQSTLTQMKQLKTSLNQINSKQELQTLMEKFSKMFSSVQELEQMLPELQLRLENSRTKELQILYAQEKYQKERLEEEINILMETIVWFRNLAVDQEF